MYFTVNPNPVVKYVTRDPTNPLYQYNFVHTQW